MVVSGAVETGVMRGGVAMCAGADESRGADVA